MGAETWLQHSFGGKKGYSSYWILDHVSYLFILIFILKIRVPKYSKIEKSISIFFEQLDQLLHGTDLGAIFQ